MIFGPYYRTQQLIKFDYNVFSFLSNLKIPVLPTRSYLDSTKDRQITQYSQQTSLSVTISCPKDGIVLTAGQGMTL